MKNGWQSDFKSLLESRAVNLSMKKCELYMVRKAEKNKAENVH
jgi:hypothetical protein